jgi:hypothetical protein
MKLINVIKGTTSLAAGVLLGGGIGIGIASGLGIYYQWRHPEDLSAGSAAIVVILTFPLGVLLGTMAGAFFGDRWIKRGNRESVGFDVVPKSRGRQAR